MSCLNRGGHGVFREDVDEAGAVLGGAILTDLPLAFQAFDGDLNAGDGAEEIVDVFGRGVADGPGVGVLAFKIGGEIGDDLQEAGLIGEGANGAVGMDGDVVPGGDDAGVGFP